MINLNSLFGRKENKDVSDLANSNDLANQNNQVETNKIEELKKLFERTEDLLAEEIDLNLINNTWYFALSNIIKSFPILDTFVLQKVLVPKDYANAVLHLKLAKTIDNMSDSAVINLLNNLAEYQIVPPIITATSGQDIATIDSIYFVNYKKSKDGFIVKKCECSHVVKGYYYYKTFKYKNITNGGEDNSIKDWEKYWLDIKQEFNHYPHRAIVVHLAIPIHAYTNSLDLNKE